MAPPIISARPIFEMPHADSETNRSFEVSGTFDFTCVSSNAAGFNLSKVAAEVPNTRGRMKPRLTKVRKKQLGASRDVLTSAGIEMRVNGFTDCDYKSKKEGGCENESDGCVKYAGSCMANMNADLKQFGARDLRFDLGSVNHTSLFGSNVNSSTTNLHLKDGENLFASNRSSRNLDTAVKDDTFRFNSSRNLGTAVKDNTFYFSACKDGSTGNQDSQSSSFIFGSNVSQLRKDMNPDNGLSPNFCEKVPSGNFGQLNVGESRKCDFFCSEKYGLTSNVKLEQQHLNKCHRVPSAGRIGKSESRVFVFGACKTQSADFKMDRGIETIPGSQNSHESDAKHRAEENTCIRSEFQNDCSQGVYTFRGLENKEVFCNDRSEKFVEDTDQLTKEKSEDCKIDFVEDNSGIDSARYSDFTCSNSCDTPGNDPVCRLSGDMKKLNVDDFRGDMSYRKHLNSCTSDFFNNAFVFGRNQNILGSVGVSCPINMNESIPNPCQSPRNNSELNKTSSFFSSVVTESKTKLDFCEAVSTTTDENVGRRSTSKLAGLDSSDKGINLPNLKFSFSSDDNVKGSKLTKIKRSLKTNKKLRQQTLIQKLPSLDCVSSLDAFQKNNESTGCGSPMDFSPYENIGCCKSPSEAIDATAEGEHSGNKKDRVDLDGNLRSTSPLPTEDGLSAIRNQYRKKYKLKVGSNHTVQGNNSGKENIKLDIEAVTTHEICEGWRIRGNQAYHAGEFSKAEEFYTMGINSVSLASDASKDPLLLCYSNRAATRMTLGRMKEAIGDCTLAASLDPNVSKVTLRAGRCHLILGEIEDAVNCYKKCVESGTGLCLDRRVIIEATDGLHKATRVANFIVESSKLLQEGTHDAVSLALGMILDALSISRYSELVLEMKGMALCILRKYDEVIQLCEQTLDIAEKNFAVDCDSNCKNSHVRLWRWYLQSKSHYHLGRLDVALDLIERLDKISVTSRSEYVTQESLITLASSVRELLCLKKSGNEAFHSGKFAEAVEHYTLAISKSFDSRPFMAVCLCNRAAVYQSTSQIIDAIADCSLAIALDGNYRKAISRRATLHETIRDYKQASYDLQKLISLLEIQSPEKAGQNASEDRSNRSGKIRDLRKARSSLSKIEEKAKTEMQMDFYLILGIKTSDTEAEIKKAYRKAALKHHPDKVLARSDVGDNGTLWKEVGEKIHDDADKLFKVIGEAYAVLSDSSKRAKYDMEEEVRTVRKDGNRNSHSGQSSTSFERGSWSGRHTGNSSSSERNSSRRYWHHQWRRDNF